MALLEVRDLSVRFGAFQAVSGVDLAVEAGEIVGIVGESGSGKSVTSLAVMGLIDAPGKVSAGLLRFDGRDLLAMSGRERRRLLGRDIAMIFQEPMTSLNPSYTVGFQIEEVLAVHGYRERRKRRERAAELLAMVGIPDAGRRLSSFPHQMSGGMNQRVMIAMSVALDPRLLIADEPTTALDVTIQAQILRLLVDLQREKGMGLVFITHDLGVLAEIADRVVVMYAGEVVEMAPTADLFTRPAHPYTAALLNALPDRALAQWQATGRRGRLPAIPGVVPGPLDRPAGCLLQPRCTFADGRCVTEHPLLHPTPAGGVRCHRPLGPGGQPAAGVP
ncbi:ABC transporter ATP-binding protein [Zavarzinia compransoris]|uniref:Dipeptide ABC transporter ATP-binding protein DppD n=1 Tax=Zavarzinia compransoris TaxID=1264899 RepID=A0A317E754_9PROT|nr:ABC transporter ATP-binding protein [Zavarzinia compransoris]PWR22110.1 dipeptide ABC transporter ATP-binding protein DppD [Zavarzinia compransoris]TDP47144.1 dipeptide transport system ATP-binding protein [Zavarzinia compransoris]